jgi:porin
MLLASALTSCPILAAPTSAAPVLAVTTPGVMSVEPFAAATASAASDQSQGVGAASPQQFLTRLIGTSDAVRPPSDVQTGNAASSNNLGISGTPGSETTGGFGARAPAVPLSQTPYYGLFPGAGKTLLDEGIDIHGVGLDHFLSNTTAGDVRGGIANLGVFAPAVDFDLQKLIGLKGGFLHAQVTLFGLRDDIPQIIGQTGGFLVGFQSTPAIDVDVLSVLTYEQKLLKDRLSLQVGRSNVYHYFLLPDTLDPFTSYLSTLELDGDFNSVPYPVWSGIANYHLTPTWYLQAGAFEDDFRRSVQNSNNLGDPQSSGAQILSELAYRSEFDNAAYPANLELGAEWNTRNGYSNIKGSRNTATPTNTAADYAGGGALFFQGEQIVWRGIKGVHTPPPNIAIYGAASASVDKPQPIDFDGFVGVNFTGFIPGRPLDAFGVQAHYQRLSAIEAAFETRLQNIHAGPGPAQSRNNFQFEVVGRIQATPALSINPLVQYFVDPDDLFAPTQPSRPHDGFEVGFYLQLSIGRFLGTSTKPF